MSSLAVQSEQQHQPEKTQNKPKNIISLQKEKLTQLLNTKEVMQRFHALFSKDTNRFECFKSSLFTIALDSHLIYCSPQSIIKAALSIAELQLPLTKSLGQAYIVKYKQDAEAQAEAQIGYKGWLALAERSGKHIRALAVFDCDKFKMSFDGFHDKVELTPDFEARKDHIAVWTEKHLKGILVGVKNGDVTTHFVSVDKVKQISKKSPSIIKGKYSAYTEWNLEMYQAKAIKYILSKTAMNGLIGRAVEIDNALDIKLDKVSNSSHEIIDHQRENSTQENALESLLQSEDGVQD